MTIDTGTNGVASTAINISNKISELIDDKKSVKVLTGGVISSARSVFKNISDNEPNTASKLFFQDFFDKIKNTEKEKDQEQSLKPTPADDASKESDQGFFDKIRNKVEKSMDDLARTTPADDASKESDQGFFGKIKNIGNKVEKSMDDLAKTIYIENALRTYATTNTKDGKEHDMVRLLERDGITPNDVSDYIRRVNDKNMRDSARTGVDPKLYDPYCGVDPNGAEDLSYDKVGEYLKGMANDKYGKYIELEHDEQYGQPVRREVESSSSSQDSIESKDIEKSGQPVRREVESSSSLQDSIESKDIEKSDGGAENVPVSEASKYIGISPVDPSTYDIVEPVSNGLEY